MPYARNPPKYPFLCNKNGMKADLFIPCFIDQLYPDTAASVIRILKRAGVEVGYNPEQTCCGQPAFNSGFTKKASRLATKFIDDFQGANTIVTPSASCAAYIRQYYAGLLKEDQGRLKSFETIRPGIYELSDFLVNVLKITSFDAEFPHRVTYHDSCSALRHYGIREEPRALLREVMGLELIEMKDTEVCCGFGGTFSAKFTHISTAMTAKKVENALATGARYIVSSEASCLMNMESYIRKQKLPIQTIHLADVIGRFRD
jgi:L-lactate dehydrogenase complex protein LldE